MPLRTEVPAYFSLSWEAQGEDGQQLRRKEWKKIRTFVYRSSIRDQTQSRASPADVRPKPGVGLRTDSPGLHSSRREEKHGAWAGGGLVSSLRLPRLFTLGWLWLAGLVWQWSGSWTDIYFAYRLSCFSPLSIFLLIQIKSLFRIQIKYLLLKLALEL